MKTVFRGGGIATLHWKHEGIHSTRLLGGEKKIGGTRYLKKKKPNLLRQQSGGLGIPGNEQ